MIEIKEEVELIRPNSRNRKRRSQQSGYVLMVLLITLTLAIIALTAVAPSIVTQIRRQREEELMHRGTAYARAIKRYYKKFGRYPTRIEELEDTNNLRFLRKRYKDPITGSDQWRLIHFGEAKITPTMFGGQNGVPPGGPASPTPPGVGGVSVQAPAGSAFGGSTSGTGTSNNGSSFGGITSFGSGQTSAFGQNASGASSIGTPASQMSQNIGQGTPVFGGGPIIGVSSTSEKESLKEMAGKKHYNEWEFVYDPRYDPANLGIGLGAGQPVAPGQAPGTGFGVTPGTGGMQPIAPTAPQTPTQPPR